MGVAVGYGPRGHSFNHEMIVPRGEEIDSQDEFVGWRDLCLKMVSELACNSNTHFELREDTGGSRPPPVAPLRPSHLFRSDVGPFFGD
jgi:hypothetical protein